MKGISYFLAIACMGLLACEPSGIEPVGDYQYFIFGHFYGECMGEGCVEIFRIKDGKLYEDTRDRYPDFGSAYHANWEKRDQSDYELVKNLPPQLPKGLRDIRDKVVGQPDAGDWGGLYIEMKDSSGRKYWFVDKNTTNLPGELHAFVNAVGQAVMDLQ